MKKIVFLLVLAAIVFAYLNRQRLFLRDPLASVTRDGAKEHGAQVYINYANDVLLENDNAPMYLLILQHDQPVGAPDAIKCIHYLVCLANGYPSPQTLAEPGARLESMTGRQVTFRDSSNRQAVITLR